WKYLGWEITKSAITPQKLQIRTEIATLNDVPKLVGDLNWVHNICGITNEDLGPLVELLRGDGDLNS
ncbi:POK18 protein, partial [Caloenas nicobarica]|nr:POK18 protein [Caloenas nicobarica]